MRNILIAMAIILSTAALSAETDVYQILQLHTRDGRIIEFALTGNPVTTFGKGTLTVTCNDFAATYPLNDLVKYTFVKEISGLPTVNTANSIKIGYSGNIVYAAGLKPGDEVIVTSTDGRVMLRRTATEVNIRIDMNRFNDGIYIVRAATATLKIIKR